MKVMREAPNAPLETSVKPALILAFLHSAAYFVLLVVCFSISSCRKVPLSLNHVRLLLSLTVLGSASITCFPVPLFPRGRNQWGRRDNFLTRMVVALFYR